MKLNLLKVACLFFATSFANAQSSAAHINASQPASASIARNFLESILNRNTYIDKASSVRQKIERYCSVDPSSRGDGFSSSPLTAIYICSSDTHINSLGLIEEGTGSKKQITFLGLKLRLDDFEFVHDLMVSNFGKKYYVEEYKKSPEYKNRPELHGITSYSWSLGRDKRVLHGFDLYPSIEKDVIRGTVTVELREDAVEGD